MTTRVRISIEALVVPQPFSADELRAALAAALRGRGLSARHREGVAERVVSEIREVVRR
jgi:hypothetical protein